MLITIKYYTSLRFSVDPSDLLPVFPLAVPLLALIGDVRANSMLLSVLPLANVLAAIGPRELPLALSLVI